jgi:hypothetical protein
LHGTDAPVLGLHPAKKEALVVLISFSSVLPLVLLPAFIIALFYTANDAIL